MRLEDLLIGEECSVLQAMQRLEETGRRIVFVAPQGRLTAVLTDSDVRKFILRGGDVAAPVRQAANYHPKTLPVEDRSRARAFLQQHSIDAVPLLDREGALADVVFLNEVDDLPAQKRISAPVVVMAGGLGTRLYPYTKILPKPLIPIGERPILEIILERFADFGCEDFTLLVNHKRNMIKSYFADTPKPYAIRYVDEEQPLGTGGGLCLLKGSLHESFFLTNCDILIDADYADILRQHKKSGNAVTMVCAVKHFTIPYGVAEIGEEGQLASLSEKPQMNLLTNVGMYVVEPEVVEALEDGKAQGFTDIISALMAAGRRVGVYPVSEAAWTDMGQMEELEEMRRKLEGNA